MTSLPSLQPNLGTGAGAGTQMPFSLPGDLPDFSALKSAGMHSIFHQPQNKFPGKLKDASADPFLCFEDFGCGSGLAEDVDMTPVFEKR